MMRRMKVVNSSEIHFLPKLDNDFYYRSTNIENETLDYIFDYLNKCIPYNLKMAYMGYFGSTLYETSVIGSDIDIRGVFVPTLESTFKVPHSKNDVISIDFETKTGAKYDIVLWPLWKYLSMIFNCDTNAIENLYQDGGQIIYTTDFFNELQIKIKYYGHVINPNYLRYIYKKLEDVKKTIDIIPNQKQLKELHNLDRILEEYILYLQTGKLLPLPSDKVLKFIKHKQVIKRTLENNSLNEIIINTRDEIIKSIENNLTYGIEEQITSYNIYETNDILDFAYKYQLSIM